MINYFKKLLIETIEIKKQRWKYAIKLMTGKAHLGPSDSNHHTRVLKRKIQEIVFKREFTRSLINKCHFTLLEQICLLNNT